MGVFGGFLGFSEFAGFPGFPGFPGSSEPAGEPADNSSGLLSARDCGTWQQHKLSVAVLCAILHELEILVQVHSHCNAKKTLECLTMVVVGHSKQDPMHQREASRRALITDALK